MISPCKSIGMSRQNHTYGKAKGMVSQRKTIPPRICQNLSDRTDRMFLAQIRFPRINAVSQFSEQFYSPIAWRT